MTYPQGIEMPNQTAFDQRMDQMAEELREMRSAIAQVAQALTKLSVLEERNLVASQAIEKIASRQDKLDEKLNTVALDQAKFQANIDGTTKAMKFMWGAFGGGVLYIGSQIIKTFV
jgi:hypothetical protein